MDTRKLEVIQIRVTAHEKDIIRRLAAERALNLSDFLRYCLLQEITKSEGPKPKI